MVIFALLGLVSVLGVGEKTAVPIIPGGLKAVVPALISTVGCTLPLIGTCVTPSAIVTVSLIKLVVSGLVIFKLSIVTLPPAKI